MNVRVSIVVAAKESLPELRRFVTEFLARRPENASLVVVDGGSRDGTAEWLETVAHGGETAGLRWLSRADSGLAEAWNRGVAMADGDWILFLGCDDHFAEPPAWRDAVETLAGLPDDCGIAAFAITMVSPTGTVIDVIAPRLGRGGKSLLAVNTIPHQGCFHRRLLWDRLGPFDVAFSVACDYEFLLRAWVAGVGIRVFARSAPTRMAFGGLSKRDPLRNLREFRAAQIRHGVRRFRVAWWSAWARAVLRRGVAPLLGDAGVARSADLVRRLRGLPDAWTVR